MNLTKAASKVLVGNSIGMAVGLLGWVYFSRTLGPTIIGAYFLFQSTLELASFLADMGINGAVEKRISEGSNRSAVLGSALLLKSILVSAASVILILISDILNSYIGAEVSGIFILCLLLNVGHRMCLNTLRGELRAEETPVILLSKQLIFVIFGVVVTQSDPSIYALTNSLLLALIVSSLIGVFKIDTRPGFPTVASVKSLIDFGRHYFVSHGLAGYLYNWMDVAVIGYFYSAQFVGLYEIAWRLASVLSVVGHAIDSTIYPQVSRWAKNNDVTKIESLLSRAILPSMILPIGVLFGSFVLGDEVLSIIFGNEFAAASLVLSILLIEKVVRSIHTVYGHSLAAINREGESAKIASVAMLVNAILNVILVNYFGITGAAIATATAATAGSIAHVISVSEYITVDFPVKDILWSTASALGMVLLLQIVSRFYLIDTLFHLIVSLLFGGVIYIGFVLSKKSIRNQMRYLYNRI